MKILYFHQYFSTPRGAGGTRSYELAKSLIRAGHSVHMICGSVANGQSGLDSPFVRGKRHGTVDGIEVTEFHVGYSNHDSFVKRSLKFLLFALRSIVVALRENYDVVYATSTPLTASLPGIAARGLRRKFFVFEVRDLWPELPREMGVIKNPVVLWAMSALEFVSYRSANACVALSPGILEGIRKRSAAKLPIAMIPNGCDIEIFQNKTETAVEIDGIEEGDFVATYTGSHGIANGLDAVLDAAKILQNQALPIKFLFIGDGKLKPALQDRCKNEEIDNCIFHPSVPKTELPRFMARAHVAMMILDNIPAFYYGTSPNKFFDYISIGLPVINNYPGWLANLIAENKMGIAVEPDSPQAFADGILALANLSDQERRDMGENARNLAVNKFNRNLLADELVTFLETHVPKQATQSKSP